MAKPTYQQLTTGSYNSLQNELEAVAVLLSGTYPDGTPFALPMNVPDGANVVEGATTDAAVTSDANGTLSAKLRGLVKMLSDVWDSVNHRLNVAIVSGTKLGTPGTGATASTAAAIGSASACQSVLLVNTHAQNSLLWGSSTGQSIPLNAGDMISIPASDVSQVYVKNGSGSATFAYQPVIAA